MSEARQRRFKVSAGIVYYRGEGSSLEVLIAHPGGPFWQRRDLGAWSFPKGEADPREELVAVARREFTEETGIEVSDETMIPLGTVTQRGGKIVHAWAVAGDADEESLESNSFTMEWPPGSGLEAEFPEIDRYAWATVEEANAKLNPAQVKFIERLVREQHRAG